MRRNPKPIVADARSARDHSDCLFFCDFARRLLILRQVDSFYKLFRLRQWARIQVFDNHRVIPGLFAAGVDIHQPGCDRPVFPTGAIFDDHLDQRRSLPQQQLETGHDPGPGNFAVCLAVNAQRIDRGNKLP